MKLVRSWPATIPEGRNYVVDGIERLVMDGYDYRCLADVNDDVVLIEWDIAVGGDELATFMSRAAAEPDRVRVAPYILYPASTRTKEAFYIHRIKERGCNRYVTGPEDTYCHTFGFGLIYLPRELVLGFLHTLERKDRFRDGLFSYWHRRNAPEPRVPIDWDVNAVHLHYDLPEVPDVVRQRESEVPTPAP